MSPETERSPATEPAFPEHLKMPPTPVLETERLILRPPRESDTPVVQRRFPQWEIVRYLHAEVPWPYPENGAAEHAARMRRDMATREKSHWAITLRGGGDELIGLIGLWKGGEEARDQRGFWLDTAYWGQGLMTEGRRPRHRLRAGRARLAAPVALKRRGQPCLAPGEGKAGRDDRGPHAAPLRVWRRDQGHLAADP